MQSQQSLPIGGQDWRLWGNGFLLTLTLLSVDPDGTVHGQVKDANGTLTLEQAFWDEVTKQLTFQRTLQNGEVQTFTGDLFDYQISLNEPNTFFVYDVLAGTFTGHPFEDLARPNFGWFALHLVNPVP